MRELAPLLLLSLSACATVQVGDHLLLAEDWKRDRAEIEQRASFELRCPVEKLKLTVLATLYNVSPQRGDSAKQVGVEGCDHRLVYIHAGYPSGWILNSSDKAKL